MRKNLILAINPGSTSTKIGVFEEEKRLFCEEIEHKGEDLQKYKCYLNQTTMRKKVLKESLNKYGYKFKDFSIVMGRGGLLPPLKPGAYKINKTMIGMILNGELSPHASNLGAVLADYAAQSAGVSSYIYDAVSCDEFLQVAKITGMKEIKRRSLYHFLNSREVATRFARARGKSYDEMNLIVAHLGGGISIGVHQKGRVIDSHGDDYGPFGPERSGGLPVLDVIEMCYGGNYTKDEMKEKVRGRGGLRSHLDTADACEVMRMIEKGESYAALVMEALAYNIAKGIGAMLPVLKGQCDGVILTGGLANMRSLMYDIKKYLRYIKPIVIAPGSFELDALAAAGLRILKGEEIIWEL